VKKKAGFDRKMSFGRPFDLNGDSIRGALCVIRLDEMELLHQKRVEIACDA
jgi:hypothetical protein